MQSYLELQSENKKLKEDIKGYIFKIKKLENNNDNAFLRESILTGNRYEDGQKSLQNLEINYGSDTICNYKKLLLKAKENLIKNKDSFFGQILNTMESNQNSFFSQLDLFDQQFNNILTDIMEKIIAVNIIKKNDNNEKTFSNEDLLELYYEVKDLKSKVEEIFNETQEIFNSTNSVIVEENEQIEWNIKIVQILIPEIKRISYFVPSNELINNSLLASFGLENISEYKHNSTLVILYHINKKLTKRQNELKPLIDKIKSISNSILVNKCSIIQLINNILSRYEFHVNNDENKPSENLLEKIINEAKGIVRVQCKTIKDIIKTDFENQITSMKKKSEEEKEREKNRQQLAYIEYENRWKKALYNMCNSISNNFKLELQEYFFRIGYHHYIKDIDKIVEKFYNKSKYIIPDCLLMGSSVVAEKRKSFISFSRSSKMIALFGGNNDMKHFIEQLKYIAYQFEDSIDEIEDSNSFWNFINEKLCSLTKFQLELANICIVYFLKLNEFERKKDIIFRIIKFSIEHKISTTILFSNEQFNYKEYIEKKIEIKERFKKEITDKEQLNLFSRVEELIFSDLEELKYNLSKLFEYNFLTKRELLLNLTEDEVKNRYLQDIFIVKDEKTIYTEKHSLQNAKNEIEMRKRLAESIYDFSFDSITTRINTNFAERKKYCKCHNEQLKLNLPNEKEIYDFLTNFIDDLYNNHFKDDCEICRKKIYNDCVNCLFFQKEKIKSDIDLEFESNLCVEEFDKEKEKQKLLIEVEKVFMDKHLLLSEIDAGKNIWGNFFDFYYGKFYTIFEKIFEMPEKFNEFFKEHELEEWANSTQSSSFK